MLPQNRTSLLSFNASDERQMRAVRSLAKFV